MISTIPSFVHPFLWSYNVAALDLARDKRRIITNVLNFGTQQATDWLFRVYTNEDIRDCITHPLAGAWNKKSINFWSLVFGVRPGSLERRVPS